MISLGIAALALAFTAFIWSLCSSSAVRHYNGLEVALAFRKECLGFRTSAAVLFCAGLIGIFGLHQIVSKVWSKQFGGAAWMIGTFVAIIAASLLWGAGHKQGNNRQRRQLLIAKVLVIISFISIITWAFFMSRGSLPWAVE
jgi:hypothetical protein